MKKSALQGLVFFFFSVYGIASPPSTPSLFSPASGSKNQPTNLFVSWNAVSFADYYRLQLSTDSLFGSSIIDDSTIAHAAGQGIQSTSLTGLYNNTKYYWRIAGKNVDGWGAFSSPWGFTTITSPPVVPTLSSPLHAVINQATSVSFSWGAVVAATSYHFQLSFDSLFQTIAVDTTLASTSKTISTLANSTQYFWRVSATNAGGNSAYSSVWKLSTIIATPSIVSPALYSINQPVSVALKWKAVPFADFYRLQVSTDSTFVISFLYDADVAQAYGLDTQSVLLNGLTNSTKYFWRLNAKNAVSTSPYTTKSSFTTIIADPAVPTLLSPGDAATQLPTTTTLSWNIAANAATYCVQVSTDNSFLVLKVNDSTVVSTSKLLTGLDNNTQYFWRVNAKNAAGIGSYSSVRSFTTIIGTPVIIAPANAATNQPVAGPLQWKPVAGATIYHVQLSSLSNFSSLTIDDSTLTDTTDSYNGLTNNTLYYWRVRAKGTDGWGSFSAASSFTTIVAVPETPDAIAPSDGAVNLSASPVLSWQGVSGASNYRLQVSTDSSFTAFALNDSSLTTTSKTIGPLKYFQKYFWRIASKNIAGSSAFSSVRSFTTIIDIPKMLTPASNATNIAIPVLFRWNSSAGSTTYRLQASSSSTFDVLTVDDSTITDTTITPSGFLNSTKYYWRIAAKSMYGWSAFSTAFSFTTVIVIPPTPSLIDPVNNAVNQQTPLTFSWNASLGATQYRLQVAWDSLFTLLVLSDSTIATTSKSVNTLLNVSKYYWRVNGKNTAGWGTYSSINTFSTGVTTPNPLLPAANAVNQLLSPQLGWNEIQGATKYHLQVSTSAAFNSFVVNDSTLTDTVTAIGPLSNATKYYWRVAAKYSGGASAFSASSNFTTVNPIPSIPVLSAPVAGATNLPATNTFTWQISTFATVYRLQIATDSLFTSLVVNDSVATTSKLAGPLTANLTYYWRVAACNVGGSSAFSPFRSLSLVITAPSTPVQISPTNNLVNQPTTLSFDWQLSPGASAYRLQVSTDTLFGTIIYSDSSLIAPPVTVSSLNNNTVFYWRVNSKNSKGTSANSPTWKFTTSISTPVLGLPSNDAQAVSILPILSWNSAPGAIKYHLQVAKDSGFTQLIENDSVITATSQQLVQLQNNTTYHWRVRALSASNASAFSARWKFTTVMLPPGVPVQTLPLSGTNNLSIVSAFKWRRVTNATEYHLQISTDSPFKSLVYNDSTIADTTRLISSLNYSTTYYWRVRARNNSGGSNYSEVWNFTTSSTIPNAPQLAEPVSASPSQPTDITLCWNKVTGATAYHIQLSFDSPFDSTVFSDSSHADTSITIYSLKNLTKYYWRVRSKNNSGYSGFSNIWNFTTIIDAPNIPTLVFPLNASGNEPASLVVKWNSMKRAERYHTQVSDDSPFHTVIFEDSTLVDTTMYISPLRVATTYYWRVRAINSGGSSQFSEVWNFRTSSTLGVTRENGIIPTKYSLGQNYPNPFNPSTTIYFAVVEPSQVTLKVYDIIGRLVATIADEQLSAGYYRVRWRGENLSAGVYFYKIIATRSDNKAVFTQMKKMLLLK